MSDLILHVSTVHHYSDTRIQKRMCNSASKDFNIGLICHEANKITDTGFHKINLGLKPSSLKQRFLKSVPKAFRCILKEKPKAVHLHDPELFFLTFLLPLFKIKVILDIHENYWVTIRNKDSLPKFFKPLIQFATRMTLNLSVTLADKVIVAWPRIGDNINRDYTIINNYPLLSDYEAKPIKSKQIINFIFSGVISFERGFKEALTFYKEFKSDLPKKLVIVGRFNSDQEKQYLEGNLMDNQNIEYFDWMDQNNLREMMYNSHFGFIFFHDIPNHQYSIPNKLFEYLNCGVIPLTSDLPYLSSFINKHDCGVSANIYNPHEYETILRNFLKRNKDLTNKLYELKQLYNWKSEYNKLCLIYKDVL